MEVAQKSISKFFPYGNINLSEMRDKLCKNGAALIVRSRHEINHIISELYKVDDRIRFPYSIIKTMELLLFLSLIESKDTHKLPSFLNRCMKQLRNVTKLLWIILSIGILFPS